MNSLPKSIFAVLCSFIVVLLVQDIEFLGIFFALFFLVYTLADFRKGFNFSYIHIWNIAFVYIVCSEIILRSDVLQDALTNGAEAVKLCIYSNLLVNLGYLLNLKRLKVKSISVPVKKGRNKRIFYILFGLSLLYFLLTISRSLAAFREGRFVLKEESEGSSFSLAGILLSGIGLTLPTICSYYFRFILNYRLKVIFAVSLLFYILPQILWGTRFFLLFSIIAPVILLLWGKKIKPLNFILVALFVFIFLTSLNYLRYNRDAGEKKGDFSFSGTGDDKSLAKNLANYGSNEGVVVGSAHLITYTQNSGFLHGEASSFILYFWIPRAYWPGKPTQISYWLIRSYSDINYSEVHSASYGFWGELFIDFGYVSLILFLIAGYFMRRLDLLRMLYFKGKTYKMVFYTLLFPFFFLAVRSPQTAVISGASIYLIYWLIKQMILKINKT